MTSLSVPQIKAKMKAFEGKGIVVNILADGEMVAEGVPASVQAVDEVIRDIRPNTIVVQKTRKNGKFRNGEQRYIASGEEYEANATDYTMSGPEDDDEPAETMSKPVASQGPTRELPELPASSGKFKSIEDYAYQDKLAQLMETRAELARVRDRLENAEKELIKKDKEILQHEYNARDLQSQVNKSKGLNGIVEKAAENPEMVTGIVAQAWMGWERAKEAIKKEREEQQLLMSNHSPIAKNIADSVTTWPEEKQKEILKMVTDQMIKWHKELNIVKEDKPVNPMSMLKVN